MYTCKKCWNKKEFIENYTDSVRVYITDNGELCYSEQDPKLIEVVCVKCWDSTEDRSIMLNWEQLIIS